MNPDPIARYLLRLPTLITFFFSIMLVAVFNRLSALFNWTTGPSFDIRNLNHDLTALAFLVTLFFVVSVWLSYSLLIERFPYSLDYTTFFFDVVRFSVLFMIFNFAFLAGNPPDYFYYTAMLGVFHLLMAGWHAYQVRNNQKADHNEHASDIRGHLLRMGTYFVLAIIYYVFVTLSWQSTSSLWLHATIVVITSVLLVYWNVMRLGEVRAKALKAREAARLKEVAKTQPSAELVR